MVLRWMAGGQAEEASEGSAVSDLAVRLLNALPAHRVLDLCGAHASQLLLELHRGLPCNHVPAGALVINSSDPDWLQQLASDVGVLPHSNAVFTCCHPRRFPALLTASHGQCSVMCMPPSQREPRGQFLLKFDRVICSLPSSHCAPLLGAPATPWSMHTLQVGILQRGLQLLAPGGRLVYMSRSMHAIENEAVVATVLLRSGCSLHVELQYIDDPQCVSHCAGLETWDVPHPERTSDSKAPHCFQTWDEVPLRLRGVKIRATMFPPLGDAGDKVWVRGQLRKCLRTFSTDGLDNAFFAVFQKREEVALDKLRPRAVDPLEDGSTDVCDTAREEIHAGSRVVVRATGAPAVVIGPGSKAYQGLVKIRYPDRSTFHVVAGELAVAEGVVAGAKRRYRLSRLQVSVACRQLGHLRSRSQSLAGMIGIVLLILAARARRNRRALGVIVSAAAAAVLWSLKRRSAQEGTERVAQSLRGSKLLRGFVKIPAEVQEFADMFGIFGDPVAASAVGVAPFPFASLCYRTTISDKSNLYLASPALFELRVTPKLRETVCAMPTFARSFSLEDQRYWGKCPLRPHPDAAPLLACCASRRRLWLRRASFSRLIHCGSISVSELEQLEADGQLSGLESCGRDEIRIIHGAIVVILWRGQVGSEDHLPSAAIGVIDDVSLTVPAGDGFKRRFVECIKKKTDVSTSD